MQINNAKRGTIPPLVLTLDIGTSSLRARLFDSHGTDLPALDTQVAYELRTTADGGATLDPQQLFQATVAAVDALLAEAGELADAIGAVAISTLACNMQGLDSQGQAITPVYTYADTRPERDAAELRRRLDEAEVFARTGCLLRTSYAPALLQWLRRTDPSLLARVQRWLSFGDYLLLQLFGTTVTSQSLAAWSGLLNRHSGAWDEELLELLGLRPTQLAPIAAKGQMLSGLRKPWAARWPALAHVPWMPAIGDGACSNAGSGCVGTDKAALSLGTSGAIRLLLARPVEQLPWGLWAYRVDEQRTLVGGALNNGGSVLAWLQELLAGGSYEELEQQVSRMEPDSHGLTMLPFLAGDRSPIWRADARAAIVGLRLNTQPAEIVSAGLEAVAYRFALLRRLLAQLVPDELMIIASGGAVIHFPVWAQILADVLGSPVAISAEREATSRGAALFALEALGQIAPLEALSAGIGKTYKPDSRRHALYQRGLERHIDLYNRLLGS